MTEQVYGPQLPTPEEANAAFDDYYAYIKSLAEYAAVEAMQVKPEDVTAYETDDQTMQMAWYVEDQATMLAELDDPDDLTGEGLDFLRRFYKPWLAAENAASATLDDIHLAEQLRWNYVEMLDNARLGRPPRTASGEEDEELPPNVTRMSAWRRSKVDTEDIEDSDY